MGASKRSSKRSWFITIGVVARGETRESCVNNDFPEMLGFFSLYLIFPSANPVMSASCCDCYDVRCFGASRMMLMAVTVCHPASTWLTTRQPMGTSNEKITMVLTQHHILKQWFPNPAFPRNPTTFAGVGLRIPWTSAARGHPPDVGSSAAASTS